jgi:hypothetical protein
MALPSPKIVSLATLPNLVTSMPTLPVSRSTVVAAVTGTSRELHCNQVPSVYIDAVTNAASLNRGKDGVEAEDLGYSMAKDRRRSNSSTQALTDFKTKFETSDVDPVFEEELHGPTDEDYEKASMASIEKEDSTDSSRSVDLDGEDAAVKK